MILQLPWSATSLPLIKDSLFKAPYTADWLQRSNSSPYQLHLSGVLLHLLRCLDYLQLEKNCELILLLLVFNVLHRKKLHCVYTMLSY